MKPNESQTIEEIFVSETRTARHQAVTDLANAATVAGLPPAYQRARELLNMVQAMFALPLTVVEQAYLDVILAMVGLEKFKFEASATPQAAAATILEGNFLAAALGLEPDVVIYSPLELRDALVNDFDSFSLERYLMTCREVIKGMEPTKYGSILLLLLRSPMLQHAPAFSRQSLALVVGALFPLAANFDRFTADEQKEFLSNYFFRGHVIGVPFENIFKNILLGSVGWFDYTGTLAVYIDGIEANTEDVSGTGLLFGKMFTDYYDKKSKNAVATPADFVYSLKLDLAPNKATRLAEALALAARLKTAELVTWQEVEQRQTQSDEYKITEELTKLFEYFLIQADWPKFVDYFRQPNPSVSLNGFFSRCKMGLDIKMPNVQERIMLFQDFLKKQKLLPTDQDILVFHESDNQFHWNEAVVG